MRPFSLPRALLLFLVGSWLLPLAGQTPTPSIEPSGDTLFLPIELDDGVDGRLERDGKTGPELVDWYELQMPAGTPVEIVVRSTEVDTYLIALLPDGTVLENDDAVGTDSIVTAITEVSGTARVGVTSYGFASAGDYSLDIISVDMPMVSVGRTTFGELGRSGRARFRFRPRAGSVVSIEVRSVDFDTYLEVEGDNGVYYYNDDSGDTTRSRVIVPFEEVDQEVSIIVSSFGETAIDSGAFELSVEELHVEPLLYPDGYLLSDGEQLRSIALPSPGVSERIESRFRFRASEGERIELELQSADFDSYLDVVSPTGALYEDDDSGGYPDAKLVFIAPVTGTYDVFAGALNRSAAGVFTMEFNRLGLAEIIVQSTGELSSRDESDITGKHYDIYRFTARRGDNVTLEIQSDEFDTYLVLRSPDGEILLRDDDGGSGLNSKAEYRIDASGEYELVVTSVGSGSLGAYSVQIYK